MGLRYLQLDLKEFNASIEQNPPTLSSFRMEIAGRPCAQAATGISERQADGRSSKQ